MGGRKEREMGRREERERWVGGRRERDEWEEGERDEFRRERWVAVPSPSMRQPLTCPRGFESILKTFKLASILLLSLGSSRYAPNRAYRI